MAEDYGYVAPVDHGVLSSVGSVTTGVLGGAAKAFGKTMLWVVGGAAALGFLWAGGIFAAAGALMSGAGLTTALANIGIGSGVLGALGMGVLGTVVGSFTGAFTGVYGAGKGVLDAKDRVSMEKGQARAMEMQMAAYQSMAAANDKNYGFPPQGHAKNPATASLDGSSLAYDGTMAGRQLARA